MAEALRRAEQDCAARILDQIDSLDVVNLVSWRYREPAAQLSALLGMQPTRAVYGPVGGESPVRYLHQAALRIANGESEVAAICGAEAQSTVSKLQKAGVQPNWTPFAHDVPPSIRGKDLVHPVAAALGVSTAVTIYPFYEIATSAACKQTPRESIEESARVWLRYSKAAAQNPFAWLPREFTAEEIATPSPSNRPIAWPYTKLMVANPMVNQGGAVILTTAERARSLGIPSNRWVYLWGGAFAAEPRDYLARDQYRHSTAQEAVLEAARQLGRFSAMELYSCFPCVPKMAARTLALEAEFEPTVTGGLTFFGAPLNNHMTHAACAMVRHLRSHAGTGLLYGQGEFVTKHHAVVVSTEPPRQPLQIGDMQHEADSRRGSIPGFVTDASGSATIETYTVLFDPSGSVQHGVVILRLPAGERTIARVPSSDEKSIATLLSLERFAVGSTGHLHKAADGLLEFKIEI
jgi:acetyl-CoA C-acetyltransferase